MEILTDFGEKCFEISTLISKSSTEIGIPRLESKF
jgi:hypothetical protein